MNQEFDHNGTEQPDDTIPVWRITPHLDAKYDSAIIRDYQDAMSYAHGVLDAQMGDDDIDDSIGVDVERVEMTLSEWNKWPKENYGCAPAIDGSISAEEGARQ